MAKADLPPADLHPLLLKLFAATPRTVILFSQGINQSLRGTGQVNAIVNLHLATGRIGKPGAAPFSITGQPNAMGGREVGGHATTLAAHRGFAPEDVEEVGRFRAAPARRRAAYDAMTHFRWGGVPFADGRFPARAGRARLVTIRQAPVAIGVPASACFSANAICSQDVTASSSTTQVAVSPCSARLHSP